jgi:hypothetical protein
LASGDNNFGARQNIAYNLAPQRFARKILDAGERDRNVVVIGNSFARDVLNIFNEDPVLAKLHYSYLEGSECDQTDFATKIQPLIVNARFVAEHGRQAQP